MRFPLFSSVFILFLVYNEEEKKSIKYKCVKNITNKGFFVDFYYGILEKTEYIIIVCKMAGNVGKKCCTYDEESQVSKGMEAAQ